MLASRQLTRYRTDIVAFLEAEFYLPTTRQPIVLAEHQKKVLRAAFTPDKEGRLPFQTILLSCVKKSGKSTLAAGIMLWFALVESSEGPNELFAVANDLEQSRGRVFKMVTEAIRLNPRLRQSAVIKQNEIQFHSTGTTITALASDYASAAGSNHGLVVWDELWAYTSERSRRLWDELTPVPTRRNSVRVIVSYAGFQNESALLWELYQRGLKGRRLFDDLPVWAGDGLLMLWDNVPRMPWQTDAYYESQRLELRPNAFLRLHRNEWVTGAEGFIDLSEWDACVDPGHRPLLASDGRPLFVGVDAATKHDSAAVVAVCFDWSSQKIILARHRIWQPTPEQPLDIENTIEEYLLELYASFPVERVFYDPWQFVRSAAALSTAGLPMQEFGQTIPNLTAASQNLYECLRHGNLLMYPDDALRKAASQAVAVEGVRGWRISKEKALHRIDAIVALGMAAFAAISEGYGGPVFEEVIEPPPDEFEFEGDF